MGNYAIRTPSKILAWIIAAILVYLNLKLLVNEAANFFAASTSILVKGLIVGTGGLLIFLLGYILVHPFTKKKLSA
jgi:manganese transport protein